jgi:serine/threonine protein kinase
MATHIPGYKILRTLGKGGMATVHLALQDIFEREVALKVMSKSLNEDPAFGQRFMREAQIVSRLIHPNIVTVYDVGLFDGAYYLSMEFIDGKDLKQAEPSLRLDQKIAVIKSIASALDVSGAKGYVHRDIKPENIMIENGSCRAVLMDFGIARASETDISVTQAGTAIGTPHYMSPEQAKGHPVDPRADLYSLGVVLFYVLAGYVPYDGDSAVAIGIRHITEAIPELPAHLYDLQWVIDKAMAKDPDARFQSGAEFIEALDRIDLAPLIALDKPARSQAKTPQDSPTLLAPVVEHRYGDSSRRKKTLDSFTLSFKTETPAFLAAKWPLYLAGGIISLLSFTGLYLVATHDPAETSPQGTLVPTTAPPLAAGTKPGKLTQAQQAQAEQYRAKADKALSAYRKRQAATDLALAVSHLRSLLSVIPNDEAARETLVLLADEQVDTLAPLFLSGNFNGAQKNYADLTRLFPDYTSAGLDKARSLLAERSLLSSHLDAAIKALKMRDNLSARQHYQDALKRAPGLIPALSGLEKVANGFTLDAQQALRSGNTVLARQHLDDALLAVPFHPTALAIGRSLFDPELRDAKLAELTKSASVLAKAGQDLLPLGNNAYSAYTAILALKPGEPSAQLALTQLVTRFESTLMQLADSGRYTEAFYRLGDARQNAQLSAADATRLKRLESALADHQQSHNPKVVSLRVSGAPRINLADPQLRSLALGDKLFVRFRYQSFKAHNSNVTARLYGEPDDKLLGIKELTVAGPTGETEFVIDLGRSGLPFGDYRLELAGPNGFLTEIPFKVR